MNENEGFVPPGFRFHPTEEELVGYYLKKKINSQKIDLDVIIDIDLYRMEPCQIQEKCSKLGNEEENEWYFFSYKDRKYPSGTRTNRATSTGFWKATGRDKSVLSNDKIIGMRKTLVFYNGRAPNGRKTDWIIHEYRLQTNHHSPPQEEGWVVCRAFKKPTPSHNNKKLGTNWNNNHHYNNYYPITNTNNNPNNYNNNIRNTTLIMDGSPPSLQLDTRNSSSFEGGASTSSTTLKTRHVSHELTSINNSTSVINMMDLADELDSPSFSRSMSTKNESFNQEKISYCGGLMSSNIEAYEQEKNNDDDNKWEIVDSFLGLHQVGDEIRATTSWFSDHNLPNLQSYDELEAHNITFFLGGCPNL